MVWLAILNKRTNDIPGFDGRRITALAPLPPQALDQDPMRPDQIVISSRCLRMIFSKNSVPALRQRGSSGPDLLEIRL
jgi:hypothetical protein